MNLKWILSLFFVFTFLINLTSCNEQKKESVQSKTNVSTSVVVFYSQTGTTKKVAEIFASNLGVNAIELQMENPYPSTYDSTIAVTRTERELKKWPALKNSHLDVTSFDTIYVGYPIMYGTFAPPIYTFLDSNDLSGKVIVPFCTYGSGGRKASSKELSSLEPNAKVVLSYGISNKRVNNPNVNFAKEIDEFIQNVRAGKLEETLEQGFSEQKALTPEDSLIFKEATQDYAYLNLQPQSVATREAKGIDYKFICKMKAFGGAEETVQVNINNPQVEEVKVQLIGVEK